MKARRSPLGAESQNSGLFIGQGGRPVLPPISSAFPTSRSPGLLFLLQCFPYHALSLSAHVFSSQLPTAEDISWT
jgi:hypothetical protein